MTQGIRENLLERGDTRAKSQRQVHAQYVAGRAGRPVA